MAWAGVLPEVFEFYYQDFNPKEFEMIINHRSVPLLVEIQTSIVNDMLDNNTQVYPSNKWDDIDEGTCEIWRFNEVYEEAKVLSSEIKSWIENEKIEKRDIGILVRQRADLYSEIGRASCRERVKI